VCNILFGLFILRLISCPASEFKPTVTILVREKEQKNNATPTMLVIVELRPIIT